MFLKYNNLCYTSHEAEAALTKDDHHLDIELGEAAGDKSEEEEHTDMGYKGE